MRRHIYYTLQSLLHKQGSNAIKIVSLVEKWSVGR